MRIGRGNIILFGMLSVLFAVLLVACGGGGGGGSGPAALTQVISGTASSGAAFSGSVVLKDARGKQLSTNTTTGEFTFDVTNLSAPYILKAGTLYSIASEAGTTNINPFTHVIAKSAAGSSIDLDAVFANVSSNRTKLTNISSNLPQSITNFNAAMNQKDASGTSIYSKYGLASPPDFNHGKITIDHDVDKLFADINVSVTGSTVTVKDKSGATLMSGNYSVSGSTVSYNFTPNYTNIGGLNGSGSGSSSGSGTQVTPPIAVNPGVADKPFPIGTWVGPNGVSFTVSKLVTSGPVVNQYSGTLTYSGGTINVSGTDSLNQIIGGSNNITVAVSKNNGTSGTVISFSSINLDSSYVTELTGVLSIQNLPYSTNEYMNLNAKFTKH